MKRHLLFTFTLAAVAAGASAQLTASRAEITVMLEGFHSEAGVARVALFASKDGFPDDEAKALKIVTAEIRNYEAKAVFTDVAYGVYAIAVLHDENGNGVMDLNYFKVPTEGWGASNDAAGEMERIPFDAAAFRVFQKELTLHIKMRY